MDEMTRPMVSWLKQRFDAFEPARQTHSRLKRTVLAYYNENDPKAAAWLRELIRGGHIANGFVDERSIEDVKPNDLKHFTQCHFFAGIGGWSYALRLAGWPDDQPVWTGSCPCQPFSAAGKGKGFADERHLWPAWHHLIRELRPERIFGEQVANALPWFDLVSTDLENEGYAIGASIVGAHSVGAPHIRQRLYWVGHADVQRERSAVEYSPGPSDAFGPSQAIILGDPQSVDGQIFVQSGRSRTGGAELGGTGGLGSMAHTDGDSLLPERQASAWGNAEWIDCTDARQRPIEPGSFPLAYGVPHRVGLLRGYGNAIVPQDAATFIQAYLDVIA